MNWVIGIEWVYIIESCRDWGRLKMKLCANRIRTSSTPTVNFTILIFIKNYSRHVETIIEPQHQSQELVFKS